MPSTDSDNHFHPGQEPICTSNVARFATQADLLRNREHAPSELGVFIGPPGTGKSTAAHLYLEEEKRLSSDSTCMIMNVMPQMTPKWLFESIIRMFSNVPRSYTSHDAFQQALTALEQHQVQLLMLDNADYLKYKHLEALHALLEETTCSMLLIGLPRLLTSIKTHPQLARHVCLSLPFLPLPDEEVFATFLPQLTLPGWAFDPQNEKDLRMGEYLWWSARPSLRRLRLILAYANQITQLRGMSTITIETIRFAVQMMDFKEDPSGTQSDEEGV